MLFREMMDQEKANVYLMGFKVWSKGKSWDSYIIENQKEEETGKRYVLLDEHNNLVGSLMIFRFDDLQKKLQIPVFGLASIVIEQEKRGLGFGKELVVNSINYLNKNAHHPIILLYSDIDPIFYMKLGFDLLPWHSQHYKQPLCMVYTTGNNNVLWSKEVVPRYF